MKDHMERVRMDADELAMLQGLALELGVTRSEAIRQLIRERVATKPASVATKPGETVATKRPNVATKPDVMTKPVESVMTKAEVKPFRSISKGAQSRGVNK
jgi:hypothetical protein